MAPFLILWLERTGFSWHIFCPCPLVFLVFSAGMYKAKRTCCVIPRVLMSTTCLSSSLHLSPPFHVCLIYNPYISGKIRQKCVYFILSRAGSPLIWFMVNMKEVIYFLQMHPDHPGHIWRPSWALVQCNSCRGAAVSSFRKPGLCVQEDRSLAFHCGVEMTDRKDDACDSSSSLFPGWSGSASATWRGFQSILLTCS